MAGAVKSSAEPALGICTECALCCNGALFNHVPTELEEVERLLALGFELHRVSDEVAFYQPCRMLEDRLCSVYRERPETCAKFRCLLLKAYQTGGISRDGALDRIATAKSLLDSVANLLPPGVDIRAARAMWRQWSGRKASDRPEGATPELMLQMFLLNRFLDRHFRSESEKMIAGDAEEKPAGDAQRRPPSPTGGAPG